MPDTTAGTPYSWIYTTDSTTTGGYGYTVSGGFNYNPFIIPEKPKRDPPKFKIGDVITFKTMRRSDGSVLYGVVIYSVDEVSTYYYNCRYYSETEARHKTISVLEKDIELRT